eukprot:gnl/MRDRNA2_/MRDRNA2_109025_c0_seq1.p1 gnl/MRDRNA2_/MRDRNA2_109025_c0~~gnl/MRDRNA2_/MRDRNA2_109025_c0_seq1.p1  ORF type:complete len:284 (+),score=108.77 gnl/MRDRNA2_/MRDRNA2_109025_c0_seq1:69-920(+)
MTIIQRRFQNQANLGHRHGQRVKTPDPFTSLQFLQITKKIKAAKAEQQAQSLSQVCKAQRAAHEKVDRGLRRMDSGMVALHGNLGEDQQVTAEQFVQVLQPYTSNVLDREELLDIFAKLDAKSVGHIKMRLSEQENEKAHLRMQEQMKEVQKRKSAKARLQKAVGAVQTMRRSLKGMLMIKKGNKVAPCQTFDSIAPKQAAPVIPPYHKEHHKPEPVPVDDDPDEDEEDDAEELALLEKKIAALKAAKEQQKQQEQTKKKERDAKMDALKRELEALQSEVEED